MLIAALISCLLMFTHGRSAALTPRRQAEKHIKKDIADENRRKQALAIVAKMQKRIEVVDKDRKSAPSSLQEQLDKRTASTAEIENALQPLIVAGEANCETLLNLRFELKAILTADEWKQVFPAPATQPSKP